MRYCTYSNFTAARLPSMLVAVLYLFLSTFGTLTHTHILLAESARCAEALACRGSGATASTAASPAHVGQKRLATLGNVSVAAHCAFCEWQASSVAAALSPQQTAVPRLASSLSTAPAVAVRALLPTRSTSRAPPTA